MRNAGPVAPDALRCVRRMATILCRASCRARGSPDSDPMMRAPLDFESLARPVALALLGEPNPRMSTATELRYGRKGSLAVGLDSGAWFDFEAGDGGGVLALVARVRGGDLASAARWIESCGFATDAAPRARETRPEPLARHCAASESSHGIGAHKETSEASRRVWHSTRPIAGTIAEAYLAARGVAHVAGAPALRFHPTLSHRTAPGRFPCLVAGVQDAGGRFLGIQRCYLAPDGSGKADVEPVRASLGSLAGGAVRILEPAGDALLLGEGIESTAAAVRVFDWPGGAWATLGTSGLRAVVLSVAVRRVVIAADRDAGGLRAAAALAERLEAEGRRVTIEAPPCGDFADWYGERA